MNRWILLAFSMVCVSCGRAPIDGDGIPESEAFSIREHMICKVARSSSPDTIGTSFSIAGLESGHPSLAFENGAKVQMQVVFSDPEVLTLQMIASASGSADTIVIKKKSGRFARAAAGYALGAYATASVGDCV